MVQIAIKPIFTASPTDKTELTKAEAHEEKNNAEAGGNATPGSDRSIFSGAGYSGIGLSGSGFDKNGFQHNDSNDGESTDAETGGNATPGSGRSIFSGAGYSGIGLSGSGFDQNGFQHNDPNDGESTDAETGGNVTPGSDRSIFSGAGYSGIGLSGSGFDQNGFQHNDPNDGETTDAETGGNVTPGSGRSSFSAAGYSGIGLSGSGFDQNGFQHNDPNDGETTDAETGGNVTPGSGRSIFSGAGYSGIGLSGSGFDKNGFQHNDPNDGESTDAETGGNATPGSGRSIFSGAGYSGIGLSGSGFDQNGFQHNDPNDGESTDAETGGNATPGSGRSSFSAAGYSGIGLSGSGFDQNGFQHNDPNDGETTDAETGGNVTPGSGRSSFSAAGYSGIGLSGSGFDQNGFQHNDSNDGETTDAETGGNATPGSGRSIFSGAGYSGIGLSGSGFDQNGFQHNDSNDGESTDAETGGNATPGSGRSIFSGAGYSGIGLSGSGFDQNGFQHNDPNDGESTDAETGGNVTPGSDRSIFSGAGYSGIGLSGSGFDQNGFQHNDPNDGETTDAETGGNVTPGSGRSSFSAAGYSGIGLSGSGFDQNGFQHNDPNDGESTDAEAGGNVTPGSDRSIFSGAGYSGIGLSGSGFDQNGFQNPEGERSNTPPFLGAPPGSALVDPSNPERYPDVVIPSVGALPEFDASQVVFRDSQVIESINSGRDTSDWSPLTKEEEAKAVKFYQVSIANGDTHEEAMDMAFELMEPWPGLIGSLTQSIWYTTSREDVDARWAEVLSGETTLRAIVRPNHNNNDGLQRNKLEAAVVRLNIRSLELGRGLLTEEQIDKVREHKLYGTTAIKPDNEAADTDTPDGVVDTVLDWLFGKAEAGELESGNNTTGAGTAGASGDSTEAIVDDLDASFERVNVELTSIALNNGWELPSPPPLDQPDGWGTDADIIGAINDMRTSADHGFDLPPLTEAEAAQALSIHKAAVANDDETRALSLATALTLPENVSVRDRFFENMNAVESGVPLNLILGVDPIGEVRSVGDQRIVAENFVRLNRNEPRLTADEEDAIRESAELAGSAGDDPETLEIAPEVVVPAEEANSDPATIEPAKEPETEENGGSVNLKHVDSYAPEEGSAFAVQSYEHGIGELNRARAERGLGELSVEEGAIAARVFFAGKANDLSDSEAIKRTGAVLDPANSDIYAHVVNNHQAIESGELALDVVLGLEQMSEVRAASEVAVVGTNIARLNDGQAMLDEQASNEMRMLHTGVTNAGEAIIEFNELGGLETDLTAEQEADFMLIFEQVVSEGNTPAEAALMARHLLDPENVSTLALLKQDMAGVEAMLLAGKTLAEVVSEKEVAQIESLSTFSSDVEGLIKFHQAAGNAEGVLMLTVIRGIVDTAKAHATEENPVLADGAAIMEFSKATGKTYKQVMHMIGEGDAVAYAAVMDDFGRGYQANANEDQIKTSAYSLRGFGDLTYAIGQGQGSKEAMAAGVMLAGAADFYVGLLHEDSNGVTMTGGGMSLAGSAVAAFGLLSDDPKMAQVGRQWATAASMLGGDSITTLINSGDYRGGAVKGAQLGFSVAGAIIGGSEGRTYGQVGALLGTGYDLFKAGEAVMNGGGADPVRWWRWV